MGRRAYVSVAAIAVVVALLGSMAPAAATFAGRNGRLAFSREGSIYTANPDGSGVVRLTSTGDDFSPVWSPDGRSIAFVRGGCGPSSMWVMKADGTGATQVSDVGRGAVQPALWSPDGRSIAYSDVLTSHDRAVFVVSSDGARRAQLTTYGHENAVSGWSPDGSKLVMASDRDGDSDIYLLRPDGSGLAKLTQNRVQDISASFSPDGSRIVFLRSRKGSRGSSIWTMGPTGGDPRQLTAYRRWDTSPRWSPDGRWIAFRRDTSTATSTRIELVRIAADGSDLRVLTVAPTASLAFSWSPDSTRLVFQDYDLWLDVTRGIGIVGVDGTGATTVLTGNVGLPDWQALA